MNLRQRKSVFPSSLPPLSRKKCMSKFTQCAESDSVSEGRQEDVVGETSAPVGVSGPEPIPSTFPTEAKHMLTAPEKKKKRKSTYPPPSVGVLTDEPNPENSSIKPPRKSFFKKKSMSPQSTIEPTTSTTNPDWEQLDCNNVRLLLEVPETGNIYPLTLSPELLEKAVIVRHKNECRANLRRIEFGENTIHVITPWRDGTTQDQDL